jgi:hypothetical protein
VDVASLEANRLAQNDLMKVFCAEHDIPFLDLTQRLEALVEAGRNVYFPDDAHWNAAGHEAAAQALASFLDTRGILCTHRGQSTDPH